MVQMQIDKGVPLPPKRGGDRTRWGWGLMEVGDSVLVGRDEALKARRSASAYATRNGIELTSRTFKDGSTRIWRIK